MITAAVIGNTYFMGNTFNPEECKVAYLVGYVDLSVDDQRRWLDLSGRIGKDATADVYVGFYSKRRHDTSTFYRVLPLDVFCGCAHETFDAMVSERTRQDTGSFSGLLRCTLPGDR